MPEQDRSRWDGAVIAEAFRCLDAAGTGQNFSRFHVEPAIAACHAMRSTYATTDRARIVDLYEPLKRIAPSVVVDVELRFRGDG